MTRIGEFAKLQRTVGELATHRKRLPESVLRWQEERVRQTATHQARPRLSFPLAPLQMIPYGIVTWGRAGLHLICGDNNVPLIQG